MLCPSPAIPPTSSFSLTPDCCPASRVSLLALNKTLWNPKRLKCRKESESPPAASHAPPVEVRVTQGCDPHGVNPQQWLTGGSGAGRETPTPTLKQGWPRQVAIRALTAPVGELPARAPHLALTRTWEVSVPEPQRSCNPGG